MAFVDHSSPPVIVLPHFLVLLPRLLQLFLAGLELFLYLISFLLLLPDRYMCLPQVPLFNNALVFRQLDLASECLLVALHHASDIFDIGGYGVGEERVVDKADLRGREQVVGRLAEETSPQGSVSGRKL